MGNDWLKLRKDFAKKAADEGFAAFGVASAAAAPQSKQRLRQWIEGKRHGDMIWMEERWEQRAEPARLWPDVQSIIMLGMNYTPSVDPFAQAGEADLGRISVYAQGKDYHDIMKSALKRLGRWLVDETNCDIKVFVDTAPVMEKPLAAAAGLGWQGKHSNLVSRDHGNWLFLGAIYTTLDLPPSTPVSDHCGSCSACQTICPTNAFPAPYQLDARACISYLTIENKGPIARKYRKGIGNHIYGCDDCLAICPWNKFAQKGKAHKAFAPRAEMAVLALSDLLALDDAAFRTVYAGSPVKRTGRDRMVRNALIAAGNSGERHFVPIILERLRDEACIVRGAAIWALSQIDRPEFLAQKERYYGEETDGAVRAEWQGVCPVEAAEGPR